MNVDALERHWFQTSESPSLCLQLTRLPADGPAVLVLHGASASRRTFLSGDGDRSFAEWLGARGYDVWLLDWRGSNLLFENAEAGDCPVDRDRVRFDLDRAARFDLPGALRFMAGQSRAPVAVVGHCLGAAVTAQAKAMAALSDRELKPELVWEQNTVGREERRLVREIDRLVLCAIGLFWRVPALGLIKAFDHFLQLISAEDGVSGVDPHTDFTQLPEGSNLARLGQLYETLPRLTRPHPDPASDHERFCNRLAFMYGQAYKCESIPKTHRDLHNQFGWIPIRLYQHGTENIRRGFSGPMGRPRHNYLVPSAFDDVAVTLITGHENKLWHRDSIDRMFEWLITHHGRQNIRKHVLRGYAHQDLFWGAAADSDVFGVIDDALARPPECCHRSGLAPPPNA